MIMNLIIAIILLLTGYMLCLVLHRDGTLKIDRKDPEIDKYMVEFSTSLTKLPKRKIIGLKIDPNADLSQ